MENHEPTKIKLEKLIKDNKERMVLETKEEKKKYASYSFLNKHHSKETRKILSDNAKLRVGDLNPFYNKNHTKEFKKFLSENKKEFFKSKEGLLFRKNISELRKGTKLMNNGVKNIFVKKEEVKDYLRKGFVKGRIKKIIK